MKKKLLSVLLASTMVLSLAACGESAAPAATGTDTEKKRASRYRGERAGALSLGLHQAW